MGITPKKEGGNGYGLERTHASGTSERLDVPRLHLDRPRHRGLLLTKHASLRAELPHDRARFHGSDLDLEAVLGHRKVRRMEPRQREAQGGAEDHGRDDARRDVHDGAHGQDPRRRNGGNRLFPRER